MKVLQEDQLVLHERLIQFCFNDYDREIALAVEFINPSGVREILGVGRLTKIAGSEDARFALIVKDKWQKKGIGKKVLSLLIDIARQEGVEYLIAQMLKENDMMQKICKNLGFSLEEKEDFVFAQLKL